MNEVARGVWRWYEHSERLGYDLNGWYWTTKGYSVAVDPPTLTGAARERMETEGKPDLIVVTNRTHWRQTDALRAWAGSKVAMHPVDAEAVEGEVDSVLVADDVVPGGWKVLEMPGKTLGEIALHRENEAVIVGDSLIGDPPGLVRLLPSEKIENRALLIASLAQLDPLSYQALLVGDGEPILTGADEAVRNFLRRLV